MCVTIKNVSEQLGECPLETMNGLFVVKGSHDSIERSYSLTEWKCLNEFHFGASAYLHKLNDDYYVTIIFLNENKLNVYYPWRTYKVEIPESVYNSKHDDALIGMLKRELIES